jgi:hypothetical protein
VSASFNRNKGFCWYLGHGAGVLTAAATDLDARKSIPARNVLRLESARTQVNSSLGGFGDWDVALPRGYREIPATSPETGANWRARRGPEISPHSAMFREKLNAATSSAAAARRP